MAPESDMKLLAPGVFAWLPRLGSTWGMANCGLVSSQGETLLIDTPYTPALTDVLLDAVREVAGPAAEPAHVVVTHANGDHTWGLQQLPGAEIVATRAALDHQCIEPTPQQVQALIHDTDPDQPLGWYIRRHFGRFDFSDVQVLPPTVTFTGRYDLKVGSIPVELHEVGPAHTVGDLIVHLPEQRVVFAGDIVFAGDHPPHWAGPLENISAACERILALDPEWIVPGHGPLMRPDELRSYIAYLNDLADNADVMHAQGRTSIEAVRILLDEDRYPGLGLPERLAITLGTEYRHLDGGSAAPDMLALMNHAATIAWEYSSTA
ncbi:MBL fold metallo-hydrolase [Streptomyces xanthochromogenes]|uniref:MBL fold metallo-hydrolase n=1 Tax=Streptomyces TaxID=1883 RepID=UPI00136CD4E1|nr:MBL fold metallo-hydrolase [Streptomyces sp. SID1034]MYV90223.1 MBL fold metallo-hydrolase [Streptomyces sp. SID1034]